MNILIPMAGEGRRFSKYDLPKPLIPINGKPMIQRVYEAVLTSEVDKVVVATDNKEIEKAVNDFGGDVIMTSPKHETGTDRIIEAYENFKDDEDKDYEHD